MSLLLSRTRRANIAVRRVSCSRSLWVCASEAHGKVATDALTPLEDAYGWWACWVGAAPEWLGGDHYFFYSVQVVWNIDRAISVGDVKQGVCGLQGSGGAAQPDLVDLAECRPRLHWAVHSRCQVPSGRYANVCSASDAPHRRPADELPDDYPQLLKCLKAETSSARTRAALAVNTELIGLYWRLGKEIIEREGRQGWGAAVTKRLSSDLRHEFPEMRGLAERNLRYMRDFARAWPDASIWQQPVAKLP